YDLDRGQRTPGGSHATQQRAEISTFKGVCRHVGRGDLIGLAQSSAFIVKHEERTIFAVVDLRYRDGSAENAAELVLPQQILRLLRRTRRGEVILEIVRRVEFVVAEKFEGGAMKLVPAGSQLHHELAAGMR